MKIEKIKKSGSKYKITLDNGEVINTYDNVILENNLLYDKNIDSDLLNKINNDTVYYESYNKAIKMISRRLRSEHEINEYLRKAKVIDSDIVKIIETLKRIGLINDYNFAKAYTNDRINLSLDGPFKIARSLEDYKVDSDIINEMINGIDNNLVYEHLSKVIDKKKKSFKGSEYMFRQKMMQYLINLGYDRVMINEALCDIDFDEGKKLLEMEKIYNKLSLKYSGDELILKLKNKFYTKGYKAAEINKFIDEKTVH